jgi:hypothetical protein
MVNRKFETPSTVFPIYFFILSAMFCVVMFCSCISDTGNNENLSQNQIINNGDDPDLDIEKGYTLLRLQDEYGFSGRHGYFPAYFIAYHEGWVYVDSPDEQDRSVIYRMRPDGTEKQEMTDNPHFSGSVYHDGWLYYTDGYFHFLTGESRSRLYRMRLDGSENMTYTDPVNVSGFVCNGEWIYYQSAEYSLYRINTNGSGHQKIADDCLRFIISGKYIFIRKGGTRGGLAQYDTKIVRHNLDGTDELVLVEDGRISFNPLFTDNEYLYYSLYFGGVYFEDGEDQKGMQVHRMKFNGTDNQTIIEHPDPDYYTLDNIIMKDGFIYYSYYRQDRTTGDSYSSWPQIRRLYKIRTDGTDRVKLYDHDPSFSIFGNSIFFDTVGEGGSKFNHIYLHRLSINGDSHKVVYHNGGSVYYSGYFVDNNKLYVVVR